MSTPARIDVSGPATAEEIAAILAVVAAADRPLSADPHRQWRVTRIDAMRRTDDLHQRL